MARTPDVDFGSHPVTLELITPEGTDTRIAAEAIRWSESEDPGVALVVEMVTPYEGRAIFLSEVTVDLPGQLEGTTVPSGNHAKFRETTSWDAVAAGIASYPWPVPVINSLINATWGKRGPGNVHLEALADDNGNVMTIMQVSEAGLYLRYSGQWVELMDPDTIENWGAVEVADGALALYDAFDQSGQSTTIFAMPVKDPMDLAPFRGEAVTAISETGVAGSVVITDEHTGRDLIVVSEDLPSLPMPVIDSVRDIPGAVEVALADPEHRWYVERRLKAMGLDYDLPWKSDG